MLEWKKVLIVDDEKGIVTMLKSCFGLSGYLVYSALNGIESMVESNSKFSIENIGRYDFIEKRIHKRKHIMPRNTL